MSQAGEILEEGAVVPFNGHTFRVEKVDKRRIRQVRMFDTHTESNAANAEAN
jgi:CBS domain containing-hemolysin-like protein